MDFFVAIHTSNMVSLLIKGGKTSHGGIFRSDSARFILLRFKGLIHTHGNGSGECRCVVANTSVYYIAQLNIWHISIECLIILLWKRSCSVSMYLVSIIWSRYSWAF